MEELKKAQQRLRKIRKSRKLRQEDVAKKMGLDRAWFNQYDCGKNKMSLKTIEKYCKALEIDVSEVFYVASTKPRVLIHITELDGIEIWVHGFHFLPRNNDLIELSQLINKHDVTHEQFEKICEIQFRVWFVDHLRDEEGVYAKLYCGDEDDIDSTIS